MNKVNTKKRIIKKQNKKEIVRLVIENILADSIIKVKNQYPLFSTSDAVKAIISKGLKAIQDEEKKTKALYFQNFNMFLSQLEFDGKLIEDNKLEEEILQNGL
jgi:hypothetical protein